MNVSKDSNNAKRVDADGDPKRKAEAAASWLTTQIIASNEDNNRAKTTEKREARLAKWKCNVQVLLLISDSKLSPQDLSQSPNIRICPKA